MALTWTVELDLDGDGVYETDLAAVDIGGGATVNLLPTDDIDIDRGVDRQGNQQASLVTLTLDNAEGYLSKRNLDSPLAGKLRPGTPLRIVATLDSEEFPRWTGFVHRLRPGNGTAELECKGWLGMLRDAPPITLGSGNRTPTQILDAAFDAAEVPDAARDFDTSQQGTITGHSETAVSPLQAVLNGVKDELGGRIFERKDGRVRFEHRRRRVQNLTEFDKLVAEYAGLRAAWRFDEYSGATVYDYSGNDMHLTLSNSPARKADPGTELGPGADAATDFEASSSQYGTAADDPDLDVGDTFTIYALFKTESAAEMGLFDKGIGAPLVVILASGEFKLDKASTGSIVTSSGAGITAGTWHLLVVTKDGATVKQYLDGDDVTGTVSNLTMVSNAVDLEIGRDNGAFFGIYFDGVILRMGLYATALTAAQVTALQRSRSLFSWDEASEVFIGDGWEIAEVDGDLASQVTYNTEMGARIPADATSTAFKAPIPAHPSGVDAEINIPHTDDDDNVERYGLTRLHVGRMGMERMELPLLPMTTDEITAVLSLELGDIVGFDHEYAGRFGSYMRDWLRVSGIHERLPASPMVEKAWPVTVRLEPTYSDRDILHIARTDFEDHSGGDLGAVIVGPGWNNDADWNALNTTPGAAWVESDDEEIAYQTLAGRAFDEVVEINLDGLLDGRVSNPYFETDSSGWEGYGETPTITRVTSQSHEGVASLQANPGAIQTAATQMPIAAGEDFALSVWVRSATTGVALVVAVRFYDSGSVFLSEQTQSSNPAVANTWEERTLTGTAPASAAYARVAVSQGGSTFFIDEVRFSSEGSAAGIVYRLIDTSNYYRLIADLWAEEIRLEAVVAGTPTQVGDAIAWTPADELFLRAVVQRNRHRLWVDGIYVFDEEDQGLNTGTGVGLYANRARYAARWQKFYGQGL